MKPEEFNALLGATNLDRKSATVRALRMHLVEDLPVAQAATKADVERQAVYVALKKLPREKCPCCKQWIPPGTKVRRAG